MSMKKLHKIELPRERLLKYGVDKLSNAELIALLLGSGIEGVNVLVLARRVEKLIKGKGTQHITLDDLRAVKGMGPVKATQIIAVLALANRFQETNTPDVLTPKDIWNLCSDFRASKKEHAVAFYLNTQSELIERLIISIGTLDSSLVHPREIFEPAIRLSAASIILTHNHPTGTLTPSPEDITLTTRLQEAGTLLGIPLTDHLIVGAKGFQSIG